MDYRRLYIKLFYQRALHADVIIFLDVPRHKCIWYVLKRSMLNFGKVLRGSPENCKQRLFSFEFVKFLKWVWDFNKINRKSVLDILNEFKDKKQISILKSLREIDTITLFPSE